MKKLNRKGFTLIELLAVIVVLAIVLVVTIPSVISSMNSARTKSFDNVVTTIESYMTKQYELCSIGTSVNVSDYNDDLFDSNCKIKATSNVIIKAAGYDTSTDVVEIEGSISTNGKYVINYAKAGSQFNGIEQGTKNSTAPTPSGGENAGGE